MIVEACPCRTREVDKGAVAKRQGKGLQNLHRRFDPAPRLQLCDVVQSRDWSAMLVPQAFADSVKSSLYRLDVTM